MFNLSKRTQAALAAIFLAALTAPLLQPVANASNTEPPTDESKEPIKIGFLTSLSGVGAESGQDMVDGFKLALDQIHYKLDGRTIKLTVEDDESRPAKGVVQFRKLVESDHVCLVSGIFFAPISGAIAPLADSMQVPLVLAVSGSDDLTQRKRRHWVLRTSWTSSQPFYPFGEYLAKHLHHKRIVTIASDYPYGYQVVGGLQRSFEDNGGQVVQKLWAPLDNMDFPALTRQIRKDADAVFICVVGQTSDTVPLALKDSGCRLPIVGASGFFDESVLARQGAYVLGAISVSPYCTSLENPANKTFREAFRAKYGKDPGWWNECGYTNGLWIRKAIDSLHGNVVDEQALLKALKTVQLTDAPRGPIKLDEYGNPIDNMYIRRVDKVNGKYQNTVIYTYPMVSQFWKWKPEEYMSQPAYSKDYPPCTHCN